MIFTFIMIHGTPTTFIVVANGTICVRNPALSTSSTLHTFVGRRVTNACIFRAVGIKKTLHASTLGGSLVTNRVDRWTVMIVHASDASL